MKAIIQFELPEDQDEYTLATKGNDIWCVLYDFDQHLRAHVKYNPDKLDGKTLDLIEKLREELWEYMDSRNVSFNMVS